MVPPQKSSSKSSKVKEESSSKSKSSAEKDKGEEGAGGALPGSDGEPLDKETIRRVGVQMKGVKVMCDDD